MDRRNFIKSTALAATLVGISPSFLAASNELKLKKKIVFIFRGVAYADGFNAFKKFNIKSDLSFHIQQAICTNSSFTHAEGLKSLLGKKSNNVVESQLQERYSIPDILEDTFSNKATSAIIYLHHTEIGHSSTKKYIESLELFFTELNKHFNPDLHHVIVTADIGRNEKTNSCGGRDHSNSTSLETFALFLGGKAAKLSSKTESLQLYQVLKQKF